MDISPYFISGFYQSRSIPLNAQNCLNLYPLVPEQPTFAKRALFQCPGITQRANSGLVQNVNRGAYEIGGRAFFVQGQTLYEMDVDDYTLTSRGSITGTGRVGMAENGTELFILVPGSPSVGYVFNISTDTLTQVTDADFTANGNPLAVVFVDGYFLFTTDEFKITVSNLRQGLVYTAIDFGTAEYDPDALVAPAVYAGDVYALGTETTQGFSNQGGSGFPFAPNRVNLDVGCKATYTVVSVPRLGISFVGAGHNEQAAVWVIAGGSAQKISTHAIDSKIQSLTPAQLSDMFAWYYGEEGAYFIGFTSAEWCFVYDVATGLWHERSSRDSEESDIRYRVNSVVQVGNSLFCGDSIDGRIGELLDDVYEQYGNSVPYQVASMPLFNDLKLLRCAQFETFMEPGVGNTSVSDPVVTLEVSRDLGHTFQNIGTRKIGKVAEWDQRQIWRKLGAVTRTLIFRLTVTDAVRVRFLGFWGELS